jgi:hypothetical protein
MLKCNGCALGRYVRSRRFRACACARSCSGGAELASAAADAPRGWAGFAFVCLSAQMMLERVGAELRVTCADSLDAIVRGGIGAHAPAGSGAREGAAHVVALGRCGASPQWRSERTREWASAASATSGRLLRRGLGLLRAS